MTHDPVSGDLVSGGPVTGEEQAPRPVPTDQTDSSQPAHPTRPIESPSPRSQLRRALLGTAAYLGLAAALGAVAGVMWWAVVPLPGYSVAVDGRASMSERELTEVVAADAWFAGLGLVAGIVLGLLAWRWFFRLGWPSVLIAVLAGLFAAAACWGLGYALGPGSFSTRLATAAPGQIVPIELTVHAPAAILAWVTGAVLPVLVGASLGRDPDSTPTPDGLAR